MTSISSARWDSGDVLSGERRNPCGASANLHWHPPALVFRGKDLPMDKLERAVKLSEETSCGVSAMLRLAVPITTEIVVEG